MKDAVAGSGIEIIMWNKAEAANIDKIRSGFGRKKSRVVHSIKISFSLVSAFHR